MGYGIGITGNLIDIGGTFSIFFIILEGSTFGVRNRVMVPWHLLPLWRCCCHANFFVCCSNYQVPHIWFDKWTSFAYFMAKEVH